MKKGFTLIEITVVIVILVVIAVLVVPKVSTIIDTNKSKIYNTSVETIEKAASEYVYKYTSAINNDISSNGYADITLYSLVEKGILPNNLKNPYDEEGFSMACYVRVTKTGNSYSYKYHGSDC